MIMELIFIFILPLLFICFTSEIQIESNFDYDNEGNYQVSEDTKKITFDNSIIKYYKNNYKYINIYKYNQLIKLITPAYTNGATLTIDSDYQYTLNGNFTNSLFGCFRLTVEEDHYYLIHSEYNYNQGTGFYYILNNVTKSLSNNTIYTFENLNYIDINFNLWNSNGNYNYNDYVIKLNIIDLTMMYGNDYIPTATEYNDKWGINYTNQMTEEITEYSNTIETEYYINNFTIWGSIKKLLIDNLELNDTILIDIILCYTMLWFIMFIIWHFLYLFFDMLIHIGIDWGSKERKKVS